MSTDGWKPISTVEAGARVFAYRSDSKTVNVLTIGKNDMMWIQDSNPGYAYTHWKSIPDGWGEYPKFPEELTQ